MAWLPRRFVKLQRFGGISQCFSFVRVVSRVNQAGLVFFESSCQEKAREALLDGKTPDEVQVMVVAWGSLEFRNQRLQAAYYESWAQLILKLQCTLY